MTLPLRIVTAPSIDPAAAEAALIVHCLRQHVEREYDFLARIAPFVPDDQLQAFAALVYEAVDRADVVRCGACGVKMLPAFTGTPEVDKVYHTDLFTLCENMPAQSVDMILCDLPYGTTACSWDTVIPFAPMWERFKRIIKPRGAIVLTASQPFTSALVMSNPKMFRYEWIWKKTNAVDFMMVGFRPRKLHENMLVFSAEPHVYYPQMEKGRPYIDKARKRSNNVHNSTMPNLGIVNDGTRYPSSIQEFSNGNNETVHPTQKPVALFRYLIRTYTQPGELVLDPCVGSGTTALAAREEQRHWICGDSSLEYVEVARKRLDAPFTLPLFAA